MTDVLLIAAVCISELLIWDLIGALLPMRKGAGEHSVFENVCGGFILNMALVEVAAVIATVFECPLSLFSRIWAAVLSVLAALSLVLRSRRFLAACRERVKSVPFNAAVLTALLGAFAYAVLAVILPNVPDSGLVIGQMTQDLYHDSIGLYIPGSGERITSMDTGTILTRYYVSDLFFAEVSGIHPMVIMRIVRTGLVALVSSLAVYRILYRFFDSDRTKAGLGLILYLVISMFFQRPYTVSGMLLSSGWTGNATFAAVVLPVLLLLIVNLYSDPDNASLHILAVAAGIAAVSCSSQAILVYPFAALAGFIPLAVHSRDWLYMFRMIIWLAVPVAALLVSLFMPAVGM